MRKPKQGTESYSPLCCDEEHISDHFSVCLRGIRKEMATALLRISPVFDPTKIFHNARFMAHIAPPLVVITIIVHCVSPLLNSMKMEIMSVKSSNICL